MSKFIWVLYIKKRNFTKIVWTPIGKTNLTSFLQRCLLYVSKEILVLLLIYDRQNVHRSHFYLLPLKVYLKLGLYFDFSLFEFCWRLLLWVQTFLTTYVILSVIFKILLEIEVVKAEMSSILLKTIMDQR